MVNYLGAFALLALGLYCMATRKDTFRMMIGVSLTQYAAHLLLVSVGVRAAGAAPILSLASLGRDSITMDALPQSLAVLTILAGVAVIALGLSLCAAMARRREETSAGGGSIDGTNL